MITAWKFQENSHELESDHTIPTECRKILEGIKARVREKKILIPSIDNPEEKLNKFSKQIDNVKTGIPEYVKRSFHSCCSISQEASHSLDTDWIIKQGKAPYLTRTLILELLNILNWLYDVKKNNCRMMEEKEHSIIHGFMGFKSVRKLMISCKNIPNVL